MTDNAPAELIDSAIAYFSHMIKGGLTSVPRSEDTAFEFYRQMLNEQKATESEIDDFANNCAKKIINKHLKITNGMLTEISDEQQTKILKESLEESWESFLHNRS